MDSIMKLALFDFEKKPSYEPTDRNEFMATINEEATILHDGHIASQGCGLCAFCDQQRCQADASVQAAGHPK